MPKQAECIQQPSGQRRTAVQEVQTCRSDSEVQEVCMKHTEAQGKPQSQQHRAQGCSGEAWSDSPQAIMKATPPRRDYLP